MQVERCEVCGDDVPRDATQMRGKLRCCPRCARPPVVVDEPAAAHAFEQEFATKSVRRFGAAVDGIEEFHPVQGGTLRIRVATLSSH